MRWFSGWRVLALLVVVLGAVGTAAAISSSSTGVIGPSNMIQQTGRQLHPTGTLVALGNLPSGGALTPNGRFMWTISSGRGRNDIRIVKLGESGWRGQGRVIQNILMPGLDGGVAIAPDGKTAYVSGIPNPRTRMSRFRRAFPAAGAM